MSTMLGAGVPVSKALSVCGSSTRDRSLGRILARLNETVQKGRTLSEAMAEMNGIFPGLLVHMAAMGELNGSLDRVMAKMADHYSREAKLRKKIKSAMTYPAILLVVTLVATVFMLTIVLPRFASLLSGTELPAFTRFLMGDERVSENSRAASAAGCLWTFGTGSLDFDDSRGPPGKGPAAFGASGGRGGC